MTTPNPRTLLTGTTPGPWSDQWHQPEPCVVALVGYTKIDGYNHPQERAADIAQKDKDRALAAAAPDLAARVIALENGIRALVGRFEDAQRYRIQLDDRTTLNSLRALLDGDTTTPVGDTNTTPKETP